MAQLSHMEQETIAEVGNISLGAAASALSSIISRRVIITAPHVQVLTVNNIKQNFPVPCLLVEVSYLSGLKGDNILLIKQEDALAIAGLMMGAPGGSSLGEMELSAIQEAMNQMMGYMATSMSEMFGQVIEITPPKLTSCNLAEQELSRLQEEALAVQISFSIQVEGVIDSKLIQVIPVEFARQMAVFLLSGGETTLELVSPVERQEKAALELASPPEREEKAAEPESLAVHTRSTDPRPASLFAGEQICAAGERIYADGEQPDADDWKKLDIVREIPLEVTVILGRTRAPLGNLFALDQGGVIYLDQLAGEPVEIRINDKLIARGEVVLINEQFGVRITQQQPG